MNTPAHAVSVELEVPFYDLDAMQIVWHGHYLKYFALARTALFRSRGLDVDQVVAMGHAIVVVESRCRHSFPLRYGDRFRVSAWISEVSHRIVVHYVLTNLTHNRRSARGHSHLATTDHAGNLQVETPDAIANALLS